MKRNNKGFTLVELLATIVIIGILAVFSIPVIVGVMNRSRDRIYVNDAKKLISQAEYQLKSSSNDIESPAPDDCIIMSLLFLDNGTFDSAPNKGKYDREHSYVIVKNNNGKFEYSVTLIENISGGSYKGIDLTQNSSLYESGSLKRVKSFKASELKDVESDVSKAYINSKLGSSYLSGEITAVYNYRNVYNGNAVSGSSFTPKIVKARLQSVDSYNSLNVVLSINATDADTPTNELLVYYSLDSYKKYNEKKYGNTETFNTNINLNDLGSYSLVTGGTLDLYVMVVDPDGNMARKKITYQIHRNLAPEITDESFVSKRTNDSVNMTTGLVNLVVSDDMDDLSKLQVCLSEYSSSDPTPTTCTNYKKYKEYFTSGTTMEYKFTSCPGGICKRDGSTHNLIIYVKDSLGLTTSKNFVYTFSINSKPRIKSMSVNSKIEAFTSDGSKNVTVKLDAEDDLDIGKTLLVTISDGKNTNTYKYSENSDDNYFAFTINGNYDGSTKTITATVTDSEGEVDTLQKNYKLYKNKEPVISSLKITSAENRCTNVNVCGEGIGGSKKINIDLKASDDIDYQNNYANLKVCVSELESDCNNDANYKAYSNYTNVHQEELKHSNYDGSTKTIYVKVKDTSGLTATKVQSYTMYSNISPKIISYDISSKDDGIIKTGNKIAVISLVAEDDVDSNKYDMDVTISGGVSTVNKKLSDFKNGKTVEYLVSNTYTGDTKNIVITVKDEDKATNSVQKSYKLYKNNNPVIEQLIINTKEAPCDRPLCAGNNSYKATYNILASDEDARNKLKICVSENENYCNDNSKFEDYGSKYYTESNGSVTAKNVDYTFSSSGESKPYQTGGNKKLYVTIMDTAGAKTTESVDYNVYTNKAPIIMGDVEVVSNAIDLGIEAEVNIPSVTYSVNAVDDFDSTLKISYCYKLGNNEHCTSEENFLSQDGSSVSKRLDESFFGNPGNNGAKYILYAKIKDNHGLVTKTSDYSYTLYKDGSPKIIDLASNVASDSIREIFNVAYIDRYYWASGDNKDKELTAAEEETFFAAVDELFKTDAEAARNKLKEINMVRTGYASFKVSDYFDTYNICIGTDKTTCTSYSSQTFDGNNDHVQTYSFPLDINTTDETGYYLFVKDSHGNVTTSDEQSFSVTSGTVKASTLLSSYEECALVDNDSVLYEYEFDETKTKNDGNANNSPISMNLCGGKCYAKNYVTNQENNIIAYYKQKITFKDRFNSSISCTKRQVCDANGSNCTMQDNVNEYKADCSFKDCFLKNGSYERNVIGTDKVEDDVPWTTTVNNKTYECHAHYRKYRSKYDSSKGKIVLTEIKNEFYCAEAVDAGAFNYNSSAADPFVRISEVSGLENGETEGD